MRICRKICWKRLRQKSEVDSPYFVDKSMLLKGLFPLVKAGNRHICITRPRCFGKSVMAAMIGASFGKGIDSSSIFDTLRVAQDSQNSLIKSDSVGKRYDYREYMNQYNVIYINFIEAANESSSYQEFISTIKRGKDMLISFSIRNGRVLLVGIGYDKKKKDHHCRIEFY